MLRAYASQLKSSSLPFADWNLTAAIEEDAKESMQRNRQNEAGTHQRSASMGQTNSQIQQLAPGPSTTNTPSSNSQSVEPETECVVCCAPASGIHYMAWSCNGCKTFFRRAVMENRRYSCSKNGNCVINVQNRCTCRYCRLQKCFRVGMKFTEINLDRKRKVRVDNTFDLERIRGKDNDPLICDLLVKEKHFRTLLTSKLAPIFTSLEQALLPERPSVFSEPVEKFERHPIESEIRLNFYIWRSRILSTIIEWAKSLDEFQQLPVDAQKAMVVHSAFSLLPFSEAFHTPDRYSDRLVYPDGLQVTRNFSKGACMMQNQGLNQAMVAVINDVLVPIRRIQLTEVEYVLLTALIFFDPDCLALNGAIVEIVQARRDQLLSSLSQHLIQLYGDDTAAAANRKAQLLLRIPKIQKVAAFKRHFFEEIALKSQSSLGATQSSLAIEIALSYPSVSLF